MAAAGGDKPRPYTCQRTGGGGSAILPGPDSSSFANQDFASRVAVARVRCDIGTSFISFLATDREISGGGSNRVFGPDFQWRPNATDTVTGQILFTTSRTPNRPDLAPQWDGRTLSGGGADVCWSHSTRHFDASAEIKAFGEGFRADAGFVPQVGFRYRDPVDARNGSLTGSTLLAYKLNWQTVLFLGYGG